MNALRLSLTAFLLGSVCACGGGDSGSQSGSAASPGPAPTPTPTPTGEPFTSTNGLLSGTVQVLATFALPYAVAPLADGRALVLEADNGMRILQTDGSVSEPVTGFPANFKYPYDVILAPDYATSHRIFVSYPELGPDRAALEGYDDGRGDGANLAVLSAVITFGNNTGSLSQVNVIWRQQPRSTTASGEFGAKMTFSPDGRYLFVTAGDRSSFLPAQDNATTLGKVIRIFPDGSIPPDNPHVGEPDVLPEIWTTGHRNPYGLVFDVDGRLWEHENGPQGGDELNLLTPGANYGWPLVSWGNHYDGGPIAKPAPGDGFVMPAIDWTPAIAPSGMIIYRYARFPKIFGHAVIGGLKSKGLVIVKLENDTATEVDRLDLGARIR